MNFQLIQLKILFFLAMLLISGLSQCAQKASGQTNTEMLRQKLQKQMDDWHKSGKFAGATAGVILADGTSLGLATGYSDRDAKTPMRDSDLMLAGSVGKTYCAAAAMQMIREGYFNLDDKVEKYLGKEKWFTRLPNAKDITVRQLMNHTSGLVRYEFKDQFTKDLTANPDKVWKPEELLSYLFDTKADFAAGKGWDYSDTNYIVLGMIMEKTAGKKYYAIVKERVLKPLKLKNTVPSDKRVIKGLVQGYAGKDNPFGGKDAVLENGKFIINPQFEWTGGGIATTAEELAFWTKAMYEGRAFPPEMLPSMLEGVSAPMLGRETKYGLGVIIRPTRLGLTYGHSGFFPGYMTDVMYFPDKKIAVAVQVNSSVPPDLGKPLGRVLVELAETVSKN
jgi:D-alanyl-D-alanine carboxypeptidase